MIYKFMYLSLVLAMLGSAQAGQVVVTASGNIGEFEMTNTGISGSTATIQLSAPEITSQLNTVNGAFIPPELVMVNSPITLDVTQISPGVYSLGLVPPNYTETIGAIAGQQAELAFNLTSGATPAALPNFFNASGAITLLLANANPLYDFADFAQGGDINFAFTATSFGGTSSFAGLFDTVGATAVGNGSFSQAAVPEPSSIVMLSLGCLGIAAIFRRFLI